MLVLNQQNDTNVYHSTPEILDSLLHHSTENQRTGPRETMAYRLAILLARSCSTGR